MNIPETIANERARLEVLKSYKILDIPHLQAFTTLLAKACNLVQVSVGFIGLND